MAKFTDAKGRPWLVEITVGAYRRLKRDTPLDLDAVAADNTKLATILYGDKPALFAVMDCLLAAQITAAGLTADEVDESFDPATIGRFVQALVEAIVDFFLQGRALEAVKEALGLMMEMMDTVAVEAVSQSSKLPASVPASADSTPPASPSANSRGWLPSAGI